MTRRGSAGSTPLTLNLRPLVAWYGAMAMGTHLWRLLGLEEIGMELSSGYAVVPEQSTVAIIAHHPQAVYFGMKSGFVPEQPKQDELIAGTERGGAVPTDADPDGDGTVEAEVGAPSAETRSA